MSKSWDLYDENRRRTSLTLEGGRPVPKGMYRLFVNVWLVNRKGQYLLSRRHPDKTDSLFNQTHPLFWECTTGPVLAGESSLEGALREVREKLGVMLNPNRARVIHRTRRDETQELCDVWRVHADAGPAELAPKETEAADTRWVDKKTLLELSEKGELHPLIDYVERL